jgi:hypothetical protein
MSKVLLVGFKEKEGKKLSSIFGSVGVTCETLPHVDAALEKIPADPPTLVFTAGPDHIETLYSLDSVLKSSAPATPFLVMLNEATLLPAMEAMKAGAYDCLARPYDRYQVLAAAKRATHANGRTLFSSKVVKPPHRLAQAIGAVMLITLMTLGLTRAWNGPPRHLLDLGSASLSGIQWQDRSLWVGNWLDSTVTHYFVKKGFLSRWRSLSTTEIFKMQDSAPILVCNTPEMVVTVGFDLKFRTHQRGVGLPTMQTTSAPALNPTGLIWDGNNIWSSDGQTGLIYKHGSDLRVLDSVKSIIPQVAGLAWDGRSIWVLGGSPFRVARLEVRKTGVVWTGPYTILNFLREKIIPSGFAAGFGRLWVISGGDPNMMSRSIFDIQRMPTDWVRIPAKTGASK